MNCQNCQHPAQDKDKFCSECGEKLQLICLHCHSELQNNAKFCSECGTATNSGSLSTEVPKELPKLRSSSEPERRQGTMMFCDLVGSTGMSEQHDPEDMRELLQKYHEAATPPIRKYGGQIAQMQGDGLVVYFGYPTAHEDDPRRAALASLEILNAVQLSNQKLQQSGLSMNVRIGLHTGEVLVDEVGDDHHLEILAIGETPNIAARVQSYAQINTVYISEVTAQLCRHDFELEDFHDIEIRGLSRKMTLHRVVKSNHEMASTANATTFVGRRGELQLIEERWKEAKRGQGRIVTVHGDPGIGKTRLVREFQTQIQAGEGLWLECRSSPYFQNSSMKVLEDFLAFICPSQDPSPDVLLKSISDSLQDCHRPANDIALLAPLFGIESLPEGIRPPELMPQVRKAKAIDALCDWLSALSQRQPLSIFVEDVHWLDQSSLEFLGQLLEQISQLKILAILSYRKGFQCPWEGDSSISLSRLPKDEVMKLAQHISQQDLSRELVDEIVQRGDGVPLYIEELTKMVKEKNSKKNNSGSPSHLSVPDSLQGSLLARLDHLAPLKRVVQAGSLIGRTFTKGLLSSVLDIHQDVLTPELDKLVDAEILIMRRLNVYAFKHALLQDAARDTMTRKTKIGYHHRITSILEHQKKDILPEVLAHHCSEAEMWLKAIDYAWQAGQNALMNSGLAESIHHLKTALSWCSNLKHQQERILNELKIHSTLGVPLMLTKGFAAPEVEEHYQSQLNLCRQMDQIDKQLLFPALWGLWTYYEVSAQLPKAQTMGEKLLSLSKRDNDSSIQLAASTALGAAYLLQGKLKEAKAEFKKGISIYRPEEHAPLAFLFGQDAGAMCLSFMTWLYALENRHDRVQAYAQQSLELCSQLHQPTTDGFVYTVLATTHCLQEDYVQAEILSNKVITLANELGFPHWHSQGKANLGWAKCGLGQLEEGTQLLQEGIQGLKMLGTQAAMSFFEGALAQGQLEFGDREACRQTLQQALRHAKESKEHFYLPELYRLKALSSDAIDGQPQSHQIKLLNNGLQLSEKMGLMHQHKRLMSHLN